MNNIGDKSEIDCFGCEACIQICPQNCITMKKNNRGFFIPQVDKDKCINCGKCKKVCPFINKVNKQEIQKNYAAKSNDKNIINISTSGGVFLHLAKYIISNKGIVFGVAWNDKIQANHIKVDNENDLIKLSQSKYVQSNINNTFFEAKKYLDDGEKVLYSGTGCQIAGLINFLGRKYENLYTVEVACHGVPSSGLFEKYLTWFQEKEGKKIKSFTFRNKKKHKTGEHYMFCVEFLGGKKKYYYANEDPYYSSFLSAGTLRGTCYKCEYKGKNRVADITLADYWGIEKSHKRFPAQNGASAIMISTEKGKEIFEKVKENLEIIETSFESISDYNKSLINSSNMNQLLDFNINDDNRELFEKLKPKITIKSKIKNMIPGKIKYYLKRIR